MTVVVTITLVPSIILAYGIVQRTIFETNAKNYVEKVLSFEGCEVINTNITYAREGSTIEVILMGTKVSDDAITVARNQLTTYSLTNTQLIVRQASADNTFDSHTMQNVLRSNTQIIDEKNQRIGQLERLVDRHLHDTLPAADISRELGTLWGQDISRISISKAPVFSGQGTAADTAVFCYITTVNQAILSDEQKTKLTDWLRVRTKVRNVQLVVETQPTATTTETL